ncbi:MAG: hypothetical protein OXC30_06730 [Alphaproteobacteria bacterium]|nr:hypothetical protein [Alphaproteobacteria bacterium]
MHGHIKRYKQTLFRNHAAQDIGADIHHVIKKILSHHTSPTESIETQSA